MRTYKRGNKGTRKLGAIRELGKQKGNINS